MRRSGERGRAGTTCEPLADQPWKKNLQIARYVNTAAGQTYFLAGDNYKPK
jgi:hypothetical protein